MTDDLVKRLRARRDRSVVLTSYPPQFPPDRLCQEAADCIEDLQRNRQHWEDAYVLKTKHEIEVRERNKELEAALQSIAANTCCDKCHQAALVARAALAGEKKDG